MLAFANSTNFNLHTRRTDVSYNPMAAGPSCQISPPQSPEYDDDDIEQRQRGSFDEGDEDDRTLAKQRECASRVAAWINQSAVRITAFVPYAISSTPLDCDLDLDNFDLDEPAELLYDSDWRHLPEGKPYLFYSSSSSGSSCRSVSVPPVIHAPTPRRPSSRSRRRHRDHAHRPRTPLYVIREEESEDSE